MFVHIIIFMCICVRENIHEFQCSPIKMQQVYNYLCVNDCVDTVVSGVPLPLVLFSKQLSLVSLSSSILYHVTAAVSQIELDAWVKALNYLMNPENFDTRSLMERSVNELLLWYQM